MRTHECELAKRLQKCWRLPTGHRSTRDARRSTPTRSRRHTKGTVAHQLGFSRLQHRAVGKSHGRHDGGQHIIALKQPGAQRTACQNQLVSDGRTAREPMRLRARVPTQHSHLRIEGKKVWVVRIGGSCRGTMEKSMDSEDNGERKNAWRDECKKKEKVRAG